MENEAHEIGTVRLENLPSLLARFSGCWKACSIFWMQAMGFPILSGIVVSRWSRHAGAAVETFCRRNGFSELLLRLERPGQRWTKRRGGYLVSVADVPQVVDEITREGMVTILLEPASPYMDHYSLTAVVAPTEGIVDVEIVGPGFDASDTLRGDVLPHERFRLALSRNSNLDHSELKRTHLVSGDEYRQSVQTRLAKIGAKLKNGPYPEEFLQSVSTRAGLASKGRKFLVESRQRLLLDNLETYKPISVDQLQSFLSWLGKLLNLLHGHSVDLGTVAVAGGILESRGLRFWDFYPAANRDTAILSPRNL